MNVLHVIAAMDPKQGGVCQAVRNMISGLSNLGTTNEVVSLDAPDHNFENLLVIHALGPATGPWCYSAKLIPWLVKNFSRFDRVIIHGLWLYPGYAVKKAMQLYIRQHDVLVDVNRQLPKILVMPHGMLDPYFQKAAGRKLKAGRNWLYWKLIERKVVNEADGLLFTCDLERKLARETFIPYVPNQEIVVGLGVEPPPKQHKAMDEAFKDKCKGLMDQPYLLYIGRINEKKGVDLLIEAYAAVTAEAKKEKAASFFWQEPNSDVPKLVIAGPGLETSYGKHLQQKLLVDCQISSAVYFTGMLEGNAKWGAIYNCEAFILPSHQENFGIAVVEAMACRKAVLISNKINISKEIQAFGGGLIEEDTFEGTKKLANDWLRLSPAAKKALATNAFDCYRSNFSSQQAARRFNAALVSTK